MQDEFFMCNAVLEKNNKHEFMDFPVCTHNFPFLAFIALSTIFFILALKKGAIKMFTMKN